MKTIYTTKIIHLFIWLCLGLGFSMGLHAQTTPETKQAIVLDVNGAITPASQDYIKRGLSSANEEGAALVIIRMDTPGGLDLSMRGIIKAILASPIPVATYVAPSGARAASAGTYILYASHIAAMAPGTNLGAATPVNLSGGNTPMPNENDKDKKPSQKTSALDEKIKNDAIAYIRGLAELRGRNADWAESAVRQAASIPASEALKLNVIDFIANDIPDLLNKANGKTVNLRGQTQTLHTENLTVKTLAPDWRTQFLAVITDPNIAYILLMIGIYGLIFEFANPGFVIPGVIGAIALIMAFYALQLLPINYAGLALIILGIAFMIAEAMIASFGILGIGGIVSFIVGSILLLDSGTESFRIAWTLIFSLSATTAVFFLVIIGMVIKARRKPVVSGREELIGVIGKARTNITLDQGEVRIHSEIWQARSAHPIKAGTSIRVIKIEGLIVFVEQE